MQNKKIKIISMALCLTLVFILTACGGGGSSSSGTVIPTPETVSSVLSGDIDLSSLLSSAPSAATPNGAPADDYKVQFGYYDETGAFVNVGNPVDIALKSGGVYNYQGSISTSVVKNLIVRLVDTAGADQGLENVIPYVSEGTVEVETVNQNTSKKAKIVKKAKMSKVEINIAEVLSRIPPTTLYKLSDADVDAIATAFVAVIAKEQETVKAKGAEFETRYEQLKAKSFELSQQALLWVQNGEYDEETAWEIYEADLKSWALRNRFTREEYYEVLGAKNTMFGTVVTVDASSGALTVDIPDDIATTLANAGIDTTLDTAAQSLETIDESIGTKIESKKAELAALTVNEVNNEFDVILNSIYELTEAVIAANNSITSYDINVDPLVELTNRLVLLAEMSLDQYEIETQLDLLEGEFQKVTDILFGEMLYHSFAGIASTHEDKMAMFQYFFQLIGDGDTDKFRLALDNIIATSTSDVMNYKAFDEWYNGDTLEKEFELMDTLMNYASKSSSTAQVKYDAMFGTSGFMKEISEAYASIFTTEFTFVDETTVSPQTVFGWNTDLSNAMGKIFAYIFMFDIDMPMSLIDPAGQLQWRRNVMLRKLSVPKTFTDMVDASGNTYNYNYSIVNASNGDIEGYARLWTKAEMIAGFNEIEANYSAKDVEMHGDAGPEFGWQIFDDDNNWQTPGTWANFKTAAGITDINTYTERLWAFNYSNEDDAVIVHPVPAADVVDKRWLDKPLELSGILVPAQGASLQDNVQAFSDPFRFTVSSLYLDEDAGNNQYYNDFWAKIKFDETKSKYFLVHPDVENVYPNTPFAAPSGKDDRWVLDKFDAYIDLAEPWNKEYVNGKTVQFWGMLVENSKNDNGGINYTFIANEIREFSGGSGTWDMVATGMIVKSDANKTIDGVEYFEYTIKDPIDSFMQFLRVFIPTDGTMTAIVGWFDLMASEKNVITVGDPGPGFNEDGVTETVQATWNDIVVPGMPYAIISATSNTPSLVEKTYPDTGAVSEPAFAKKENFFGSFRDFRHIKVLRIPSQVANGSIPETGIFKTFYDGIGNAELQSFLLRQISDFNIEYIGWEVAYTNDTDLGDVKLNLDDGFQAPGESFFVFNYNPDDPNVGDIFSKVQEDNFLDITTVGQTGTEFYRGINTRFDIIHKADTTVNFDIYYAEVMWIDPSAVFTINGNVVEFLDWNTIAKYCYGLVNWMQPADDSGNMQNFFSSFMPRSNPDLKDYDPTTPIENVYLNPDNKIQIMDFASDDSINSKYGIGFDFYDDKLMLNSLRKEVPTPTGPNIQEAWFNLQLVDFRNFSSLATSMPSDPISEINYIQFGTQEIKLRSFVYTDSNKKIFISIQVEDQSTTWESLGVSKYDIFLTLDPNIDTIKAFTFEDRDFGQIATNTFISSAWQDVTIDFTANNTEGAAVLPQIFGAANVINWTQFYMEDDTDDSGIIETVEKITKTSTDTNGAYYTGMETGDGELYIKWYGTNDSNEEVVEFDRWTLSFDPGMQRVYLNVVDFFEPATSVALNGFAGVRSVSSYDFSNFIPGGIAIFDKYIADDMAANNIYQVMLDDRYFGPNNMRTEMFKETNGVRVELRWNNFYDTYDESTQTWIQNSEEELYVLTFVKQTDGTYTLNKLVVEASEVNPQTGMWQQYGRLRYSK